MEPSTLFSRAVVVNLERRPDRLARFKSGWAEAFENSKFYSQVPELSVFTAFDGVRIGAPSIWTSGDGAFGCCLSHLTLWARILSNGIGPDETAAIFEDDAIFAVDFADRAAELAARVPADVDIFYLGGEHLTRNRFKPVPVAPGILRGYNVNRTHAYVATGRGLKKLVNSLVGTVFNQPVRTDAPGGGTENHFDFEIGRLTERGVLDVYAANPWLVGQNAGRSDISYSVVDGGFYNLPKNE